MEGRLSQAQEREGGGKRKTPLTARDEPYESSCSIISSAISALV